MLSNTIECYRVSSKKMNKPTVFTFWEPEGSLPPYIKLCIDTWRKNLTGYEIKILNYSNLFNYIRNDVLDIQLLEKFPLMIQKDAIEIAVLEENGGVFLDADLIILKDISPLLEKLENSEVIMFANHVAFIAAKPKSKLMTLWLNEIRNKMTELKENKFWGFLCNKTPENGMLDKILKFTISLKVRWPFLANSIQTKLVKKCSENEIKRLNKIGHAFILEEIYFREIANKTKKWKYKNFWFNKKISIDDALIEGQSVIALHNSWTPKWYKELSEADLLENDCLLSRILKHTIME